MTAGLSLATVATARATAPFQFRSGVPAAPAYRSRPAPVWIGIDAMTLPAVAPAQGLPYDPAALCEEGERWDGLS